VSGFLLRRLAWSVAALLVFITLAFLLVEALPFDFASSARLACPGCDELVREDLGLDRPMLARYLDLLGGFASGSLGTSYTGQPVLDVITGEALWTTLFVFGVASVIAFLLGSWMGRVAAWRMGRTGSAALDVLAITTYTIFPPFLVFVLLRFLRAPLQDLRGLLGVPPDERVAYATSGWSEIAAMQLVGLSLLAAVGLTLAARWLVRRRRWPRWLGTLAFPTAIAALLGTWAMVGAWDSAMSVLFHAPRYEGAGFGAISRGFQGAASQGGGNAFLAILGVVILAFGEILLTVQAAMASEAGEQYVTTARAKGLPDDVVRDRHVARNALLPALTRFVVGLPLLLTGLIIVEREFELAGLSTLFLDAARRADVPLVLGALVVFGVLVTFARLALEVLVAALDPRVRREAGS
jgi:peptide/nickel transport system permease protein